MMKKATKYGIMIIAAVLVIALAFAGSASATYGPYNASLWNNLSDDYMKNLMGTVYIKDSDTTAVIYPKFNGSTGFTPGADLTLDFSEYKGTFSGEDRESVNGLGALFGYVNLSGVDTMRTLTIKNLNLTNVKVNATSGKYIGGVVGYFNGNSTDKSFLNFSDCRLVNCTIAGSNSVGGLVGQAGSVSFETCGVGNTSVYAGSVNVGGLVGCADSASRIGNCNVKNCVVGSGSSNLGGVGGLVGYANSASNVIGCTVENCTIAGRFYVGGLVGDVSSASGWRKNTVTNCAVNRTGGSDTKVNLVCGSIPAMENPANCTVDGVNFINNGSRSDTITFNKSNGDVCPLNINFWNSISYTNASSTTLGLLQRTVTSLGSYAKVGGYGVGSAPTVTYDKNGATSGEGWTAAYTMGATVTVADKNSLAKTGYNFTGWNKDSVTGQLYSATETFTITADTVFYANWTVNTTNVTASDNKAEFGNDNVTAIHSTAGTVVKVLLENVSQVTDTAVNFTADNTSVSIPSVTGYTKEEIAVFEINASAVGTAKINVTVTFADAPTANTNKDKVRFFHYNVSEWEPLTSTIADETSAGVLYTVEATSFSPFGIGIYTAVAPSYTPSSSSKQSGSTVILQPGQVAPTQAPTVAPTVKPTAAPTDKPVAPTVAPTANPTAQQTQASPAPVLGLIAGLGVAGLIYRLRK